jgi:hypothetical protein
MKTKAVIDRFEGDLAVLLVGDGENRLNIPRASLPKRVKEGQWLQVEIEDDLFISAVVDEEETAKTKQRISDKLARLRRGNHLKK